MAPIRPPPRVLIIDDDPAVLAAAAEVLSTATARRFTVSTAETLDAGLAHLAREDVDVLVLDLNLPDSSGLATLWRVLPECAAPVVVMTGCGDEEMGIAALKAGAQDFLAKGNFDGDALVRTLVYAVERGTLRTAEVAAVLRVIRSDFEALRADFQDVKGLLHALGRQAAQLRG